MVLNGDLYLILETRVRFPLFALKKSTKTLNKIKWKVHELLKGTVSYIIAQFLKKKNCFYLALLFAYNLSL